MAMGSGGGRRARERDTMDSARESHLAQSVTKSGSIKRLDPTELLEDFCKIACHSVQR